MELDTLDLADNPSTVFVVDDDPAVRDSLHWLVASVNLDVETFASGQAFLDAYRWERTGCLLTDVRMPGMSGLDLQLEVTRRGIRLPVIIITGHGDVEMAVRAMKSGAFDFVQKPFNDQTLLELVQKAVDLSVARHREAAEQMLIRGQLGRLTPRERQVLDRIVAGEPNKAIALGLGRSEKTVEFHRAKVMEKMQARSLAELMRKVMIAEPDRYEASLS